MFDFLNFINLSLSSSAASGAEGSAASSSSFIIVIILMFVVMYFFMIRPQKKREKAEQEMRNSLEIGDEIITIGGIVGRVVTIKDDEVVIETGADRNKMRILRSAINTNKTKMEQHRKEVEAARQAAKDKKDQKKKKSLGKGKNDDAQAKTDEKKDGKETK